MGSLATLDRTLLVLGSGPGIGRSVTTQFASNRYNKVVLIARRADQLTTEKRAIEAAVPSVKVKTYAVDLTDAKALTAALDDADATFGRPETVFYNAARVLPSELFAHPVEDIEYDLKVCLHLCHLVVVAPSCGTRERGEREKRGGVGSGETERKEERREESRLANSILYQKQVCVSALYNIAQRYVPYLVKLAKADASSHPSLIVTSSALPHHPYPPFFALSLVKAAQRNLVQSLNLTYAAQGVHIGVVNVGGPVSPDHEAWNPDNIAQKTWEWYEDAKETPSFEVEI